MNSYAMAYLAVFVVKMTALALIVTSYAQRGIL